MNKITSLEIKQFDELSADKAAAETTLRVALTYHSNQENHHHKRNKILWDSIIERLELDEKVKWKIDFSRGFGEVVEAEPDHE
jgi:hypothetical protein